MVTATIMRASVSANYPSNGCELSNANKEAYGCGGADKYHKNHKRMCWETKDTCQNQKKM